MAKIVILAENEAFYRIAEKPLYPSLSPWLLRDGENQFNLRIGDVLENTRIQGFKIR